MMAYKKKQKVKMGCCYYFAVAIVIFCNFFHAIVFTERPTSALGMHDKDNNSVVNEFYIRNSNRGKKKKYITTNENTNNLFKYVCLHAWGT